MKRFFEKASKPFSLPTSLSKTSLSSSSDPSTTGRSSTSTSALYHATHPALQPKYVVPPVPHPCPQSHLAVLVSEEGLLIRPHIHGQDLSKTAYVRLSWDKNVKIEEIEAPLSGANEQEELNWDDGVVVYGIVGMLELFSCTRILCKVLDPSHVVYGIKGVTDIPLVYDRAKTVLNTLAARNNALLRPSLLPIDRKDTDVSLDAVPDEPLPVRPGSPRVQFLSNPSIKFFSNKSSPNVDIGNSIDRPSSAQSSAESDISDASEASAAASPVFQTLASRLSFWSRMSKRTASPMQSEFPPIPQPMSLHEEQEVLDHLIKDKKEEPAEVIETILASTAPPPVSNEERHSELEVKVVRECIREFTKGDMYFAYNFDITRSLQHKQEQMLKSQKQRSLLAGLGALPSPENNNNIPISPMPGKASNLTEPYPALPLWRRVDRQFWWNEWMSKPFVDAGLHTYILPIMQGYCQTTKFNIPSDPVNLDDETEVEYIIISRRSRNRPGLRYQRRGIDDSAHVANFVETETIVRVEREKKENIFAYVQIRGSIPLYWTQNGYGLKPPPVLSEDRTHAQNLEALKKHFSSTIPLYGPHTIVNLAEQHGKEGVITDAYREYMHELNMKDAQYCEYDFHTETKGMKYENISTLIGSMERTFETQGYFWVSDNVVFSQQKGVFRVNCIDCLDRTNVVQSAFARYVLNKQLSAVALLNPSTSGRTDADLAFNDVWANNGDAISRAYAGTSALKVCVSNLLKHLKSDTFPRVILQGYNFHAFRTGKRDLGGMLNDGVNSLARMYTSTFSDWFCQAVIDFMLGNRTISVFSEFLLNLKSTDPRDLIRLSKIRAEAIAESVSRVLPEGERLLSGWTLFAPENLNAKIAIKFEEKVLLLSAKALYIVSYDYTLEKVKLYTRIPLGDIVNISKGAYILSPLEESSRDPEQNAGFVVTWLCSNQESRVTSYSVRNSLDLSSSPPSSPTLTRFNTSGKLGGTGGGRIRTRSNTLPALSNILHNNTSFGTAVQRNFAAFKVLPIDPGKVRRMSSYSSDVSEIGGISEEMQGASTCKEAVDLIVEKIQKACEDIGGAQGDFITLEDVVSLAEAQRMTSVYAKMEYGVKRLLWLGG
ncbi:SacI homology domain-containing protein [Gymnopilus junonius]|uniref:SacI homology domain-containing protein n=1 Tax=Gymnopilus junonius TaxID=109634 RepID=A0A9P5TSW2_GYMJU|nr:SacI homology domain-containing protein [Gymnopilus junonius]